MILEFFLNTGAAIIVIAFISIINLFSIKKPCLQYRFSVFGLFTVLSLLLHTGYFFGFYTASPLYRFTIGYLSWTSLVLYFSFLIDLSFQKRPKYFFVFYFISIGMGVVTLFWYTSFAIIFYVIFGILLIIPCTLGILISWIHKTNDERSRRDGDWILMISAIFLLGALVSLSKELNGMSWVLALWFIVMYLIVNKLRIFLQGETLEKQIILDNIFDVVFMLDRSGNIIQVNKRALELLQCRRGQLYGSGIETILYHSDLGKDNRSQWLNRFAWVDSASRRHRSPSIDASLLARSGETIPIDIRVIALRDLEHTITGFVISATDVRITRQLMKEVIDREYASRDLALSERKFSQMFVFNPSGILIIGLDSLIISDANPAAEEIFGNETTALQGKMLSEIGLDLCSYSVTSFLEKLEMEESVSEFSVTVHQSSGSLRQCRLSAVLVDLNETRSMLLSLIDVTHEEQMREALLRKQKVETIGVLSGGIAHDFNNILAVILGHIGLARLKNGEKSGLDSIVKAEAACLRAREMTGHLLAFSRGGSPVIAVCETTRLIHDATSMVTDSPGVSCVLDVSEMIWSLNVDRIQISQVIANLVGNSIQAMSSGGKITISARNNDLTYTPAHLRPKTSDETPIRADRYVELHFKDTGPGIPMEIRSKIFEPFFSTKEKGTGLGLSIVFSIIQNHGGHISLISPPGEGAEFSILLPAIEVPSAMPAQTQRRVNASDRHVLVMDDDLLVQETAARLLQSFGYVVQVATEGEEAVALYKKASKEGKGFDFCLLDQIVSSDGMCGSAAASEILKYDEKAVLIISSGYSDDPVLSEYKKYGFRASLPKPYTPEELISRIESVLAP